MEQIIFQEDLFEEVGLGYVVRKIQPSETHYFLLNIHYAKRIPSISYAFGLFLDSELVGVVTYGSPPSNTLTKGICGEQWAEKVIELNRLCLLKNIKAEASRLIAGSLRMLPKPSIVVSFADTSKNHTGIVYQATNFIYTGLSAKRTEWAVRGKEHLHSKTLSGMGNLEELKRKFGDDFYYRDRPRKHRYIYFVGDKKQTKAMRQALLYEVLPYPKENHEG
jgi:hypothetical protein